VKVQLDQGLDSECLDREGLNFSEIVTETQAFLTLHFLFSEEHCVLQTKEERSFGVLNNRAFQSLTKLPCFQELEFIALIEVSEWKERSFSAGKDSKIRCISLDVNISGPRWVLDTTARELSRARLFLQPPHQGTTNLPYENPQYLHLPGVGQPEELPISSSSQNPSLCASGAPGYEQIVALNDGYPDFDKILEELPRHDYLKEVVVDIRVKTPLIR
jgi:SWI/SNF-related matrix-associated actin-dependent regulator of chromatin subfamily A3